MWRPGRWDGYHGYVVDLYNSPRGRFPRCCEPYPESDVQSFVILFAWIQFPEDSSVWRLVSGHDGKSMVTSP